MGRPKGLQASFGNLQFICIDNEHSIMLDSDAEASVEIDIEQYLSAAMTFWWMDVNDVGAK